MNTATVNYFENLPQAQKTLGTKAIRNIIDRAQVIARDFRQKETELISILQELDETKAYRYTGYNSLFQFCVESLELTEHQSYQYITVSRKCTEVPELMVALEDRRLTLSKARKLTAVLTPENKSEWMSLAEQCSQKHLEKAIRAKSPLPPVRDHMQILSSSEVKLQATLSQEVADKLKRVLEVLTVSGRGRVSINEALDLACDLVLDKKDPVIKAKKHFNRKRRTPKVDHSNQQLGENRVEKIEDLNLESSQSGSVQKVEKLNRTDRKSISNDVVVVQGNQLEPANIKQSIVKSTGLAIQSRKSLPAHLRHQVVLRDKGQCRFHQNGVRCDNRRYLEIHHKIPVALGGQDHLENLVLVCGEHHKAIHCQL